MTTQSQSGIVLLSIAPLLEQNPQFATHPDCQDSIYMTLNFYKKTGFNPPWISYYTSLDDELVGAAAFKGKPIENQVEIAYGVFERFQNKGIGSKICMALVDLSLATDPGVIITARTLPERNFSARLLEKNNFKLRGTVHDPEDGDVWEWEYAKVSRKGAFA